MAGPIRRDHRFHVFVVELDIRNPNVPVFTFARTNDRGFSSRRPGNRNIYVEDTIQGLRACLDYEWDECNREYHAMRAYWPPGVLMRRAQFHLNELDRATLPTSVPARRLLGTAWNLRSDEQSFAIDLLFPVAGVWLGY